VHRRVGSSLFPPSRSPLHASRPRSADLIARPRARISACLLSWARPGNLADIVANLRATAPSIDDIVVWNNDPAVQLDLPGVRVVASPENLVCLGRYRAAALCRHDIVFTQDDDWLPSNVEALVRAFAVDGARLTAAVPHLHRLAFQRRLRWGTAQMGLVGWGAVFDRRWLAVLDAYVGRFGEDALLRREADRIFALLLDREHRFLPRAGAALPGAYRSALSLQSDHWRHLDLAVERALAVLGRPRRPPLVARLRRAVRPGAAVALRAGD